MISAEQVRAITGTVDLAEALEDLGPAYDEQAEDEKRFGGASIRRSATAGARSRPVATRR